MKTLLEIKMEVAKEMGFDLNTSVYKIHFSNYTDEVAKRYRESGKPEPVEQDKLWMAVCIECCPIEKVGVINVIKSLSEKYIITRKQ